MGERPILFSGPMVRAILDGRKTQTRRIVNTRGRDWCMDEREDGRPWPHFEPYVYAEPEPIEVPCPYGVPGDLLWVRETWRVDWWDDAGGVGGRYAADGTQRYIGDGEPQQVEQWLERTERDWRKRGAYDDGLLVTLPDGVEGPWRPGIFMPRWASRLSLRVTDVRVACVQDTSEEDARAEGVLDVPNPPWPETARHRFSVLWDSINGKRPGCSWADNPWCWVVSFQRTTTEET